MLVIHCNNLDWCHHCEDSAKVFLRRVKQNWAGWTEWYIGDGDSPSGFTPRLCIFFPWIPPLLIIPYLRTQYLPKAFHSSHCTADVWQSLLCGGEAWNGCSGCTIRLVHFHSFTRSSALTLTDNESSSFIPAEQTSISSESQRSGAAGADRREVPSTRASSAASQGWSASSPMTHTSSRAHSTSEHPFRKAVWTPPTQAGDCQKKATNFSLRDRNSICWVCSWFWTPQGLQFFNNCFIRGKEKSSSLLGNLWTTISINILLGRLETLID